ncbi:replication protein [Liquorilactobacillus satsumensis]|uniref:replication protein n=1 Tax=Liquorilactobacillus satsumensis TaxID=259059 RepID=UPI0039E8B762
MAKVVEKVVKGRDWTFIVYPESAPKNWREILDETHLRWVESPLHDKDTNPDGEPKKAHWHILLSFDGPVTASAVSKVIAPLNGPIPQKVASGRGIVRYFIHMDNPEKHPYPKDEIVGHGGADVQSYFELSTGNRLNVLKEIVLFIVKENVTSFADFLVYCIENNDDWFEVAVDKNTLAINKVLDSVWQKQTKVTKVKNHEI